MIKSTMMCAFLSIAVYSQHIEYDRSYTVTDKYYNRNILIEDTGSSVYQKINNPGLYKDTVSRVGIGFLQMSYLSDLENGYILQDQSFTFNDLYAWTEVKTGAGNFGGYVGNISLKTNSNEPGSNNELKSQNGSVLVAVWYNPPKKTFFKGLSITADGNYSYESNCGQYIGTCNKNEEKTIYLKAVSLFQLSEKLHLRWGISGSNWLNESDYSSVNTYEYNYYSTYYSRESKSKQSSGNMNIGLILNKCLDLTIGAEIYNHNQKSFVSSQTNYYWFNYNNYIISDFMGSGVLSFYLDCKLDKIIRYRKHKLYMGINTKIRTNLYDTEDKYFTNFADVMKNVKKDQRDINLNIYAPVTVDINLFRLPLFAVLRVEPGFYVNSYHYKSNGQKAEFSSSNLYMEQLAFGLKGKIGEKVQFACIPSIRSNIFLAGAELSYTFGDSKNCKESISEVKK